ncbi:uncharacterized protein LOC130821106 [Amaranthus tricolor]|uniref:uncharacterized protein LOC130821106 n=1 Tax=Amaranthus tricolor TaxID=29722 RepID=UPI002585B5FE|nr:uncharacterized protein LOC130821106 [Amaranthus tricolor]
MASAAVFSINSPWQQSSIINKAFISLPFLSSSHSHHSTNSVSIISLSSTSNFNRFHHVQKVSADDNREKALVICDSIESDKFMEIDIFKRLFRKRSLWRRIFFTSKKVRSLILLNVITIVYASEIPVLKEVEELMDPATFNVVRFVVSAIPFVPATFRARNDARICKAGLELGLWVSLAYLLQAIGLLTSDAGRASFISMLTVIVVPLFDGMFGEVIPPLTMLGAILSVLGVAVLESCGSSPDVGDLFNFLSAIFFGVHMVRTERISRTTKKENFTSLLGYEVCVVALSSVIWFFSEEWFGKSHRAWTWELFWDSLVSFPWTPAIYTGLLSTGLCLWIEMAAMRNVSATETAIIYGLEPVWGAGFAWFLLGERWDTTGWIGAALLLGGSLIVQMFGSLSGTESEDYEQ